MTDPIETLFQSRVLDSPERIATFKAGLAALPRKVTADLIESLLRVFDDETYAPDVMFGLLHLIEDADPGVEEAVVARSLPWLDTRAPWWAETLVIRMLNNADSRSLVLERVAEAASSREALIKVLDRIGMGTDAVAQLAREAQGTIQSD